MNTAAAESLPNSSDPLGSYKSCRVGSIREVHQRLLAEGFHISQYSLRMWVKAGVLPAVYSGNKAYVSYANAVSVLTKGAACSI